MQNHAHGLFHDQELYLVNLLKLNKLDNMKPSTTPIEANLNLYSEKDPISNPTHYRRIVGSLQYHTSSRPDISFAFSKLSQYMESPKPLHWTVMKRVLRCFSGTQNMGIIL